MGQAEKKRLCLCLFSFEDGKVGAGGKGEIVQPPGPLGRQAPPLKEGWRRRQRGGGGAKKGVGKRVGGFVFVLEEQCGRGRRADIHTKGKKEGLLYRLSWRI